MRSTADHEIVIDTCSLTKYEVGLQITPIYCILYFYYIFHFLTADLVVLLCVFSDTALWAANMSQ